MRSLPVIVLVVSAVGIVLFSRELGVIDTVAILLCGIAAGWSLARLAALRR
jgi:hypothetical protein